MLNNALKFLGLIIFSFFSYYLAINIVNNVEIYKRLFLTFLFLTMLVILFQSTIKDFLFSPFEIARFKYVQNKLLLLKFKMQFFINKGLFLLGLLLVSYLLIYTVLNVIILLASYNSAVEIEIVKINDLDVSRNSFDYEFYFKDVLMTKGTKMNVTNREILDNNSKLNNYRIEIKYKESCFNSYYIVEKNLISLESSSAKSFSK
ncbi:hypothetical protein GJU43_09820 [Flavobacterium sp. LC2016-23]|uniref:hypothetical protein n=1 Tax=Flavobacterium sp. LC2016-23 TaxID=2666330 RepID=UPI0012B0DBE8|nr:hypothetical protein [Flavobacterium sp. LC2016-23]MRX39573.1 hypothetical protein [Flavobacterium sp. LC2016-23]